MACLSAFFFLAPIQHSAGAEIIINMSWATTDRRAYRSAKPRHGAKFKAGERHGQLDTHARRAIISPVFGCGVEAGVYGGVYEPAACSRRP